MRRNQNPPNSRDWGMGSARIKGKTRPKGLKVKQECQDMSADPDHAGRCTPPFFSAFDALAVDDRSSGTCLPLFLFSALHVELMMNALQRAVPTPQIEVVEQRATRRKVFRDRAPLTARAQNIHAR